MKIVLCAYGRAGLEVYLLLRVKYDLSKDDILIFTHKRVENKIFLDFLKNENKAYHIETVNDFYDQVASFKPDILISAYYRFIIKKNILELVNYKAFNIHPSLLPKYRGAMSSVWAIINSEKFTGVTFHFINEQIDEGKIISQHKLQIFPDDTAFSLYHKLIALALLNLCDAVSFVNTGGTGFDQIGTSSYFNRKLPFDGIYNLDEGSYDEALKFIRAMYFPPLNPAGIFFKGKAWEISSKLDLDKMLANHGE